VAVHNDGLGDYEVEDILDAKCDRRCKDLYTGKKGLLWYLVKWVGYDKPDWVDYYDVAGCNDLLRLFYERRKDVAPHPMLTCPTQHEERLAFLWVG
jgi:hypothetical protein